MAEWLSCLAGPLLAGTKVSYNHLLSQIMMQQIPWTEIILRMLNCIVPSEWMLEFQPWYPYPRPGATFGERQKEQVTVVCPFLRGFPENPTLELLFMYHWPRQSHGHTQLLRASRGLSWKWVDNTVSHVTPGGGSGPSCHFLWWLSQDSLPSDGDKVWSMKWPSGGQTCSFSCHPE